MPFNPDDYTRAPWAAGIMTLTHDECVYAITECTKIAEAYVPVEPWDSPEPSETYILSRYSKLDNWQKGINGDTYKILLGYGENTLGINEEGIISSEQPITEEMNPAE